MTHTALYQNPIYHNRFNQLKTVMHSKGGRWMLLQHEDKSHQILYHKCDKNYSSVYPVTYANRIGDWCVQTKVEPAWRCTQCRKKPPKKILTAYILLDWDNATAEMHDTEDIR